MCTQPDAILKKKELIDSGSSLLLSDLNNYNRWLAQQLNKAGPIQGTILEFGCGCGGLAVALARLPSVKKVIANDTSVYVKEFWKNSPNDWKDIEFTSSNILNAPESFVKMSYDLAISSNTLEHIVDDSIALKRIVDCSKLKTAIILVPAFDCLYGTCDRDGGHYRRYSKASFSRLASTCGLKVEKLFYFNMLGAWCWWFQYVFLRARNYTSNSHSRGYSLFDSVVPFYSKLEGLLDCPFGLSLVARVTMR